MRRGNNTVSLAALIASEAATQLAAPLARRRMLHFRFAVSQQDGQEVGDQAIGKGTILAHFTWALFHRRQHADSEPNHNNKVGKNKF